MANKSKEQYVTLQRIAIQIKAWLSCSAQAAVPSSCFIGKMKKPLNT